MKGKGKPRVMDKVRLEWGLVEWMANEKAFQMALIIKV